MLTEERFGQLERAAEYYSTIKQTGREAKSLLIMAGVCMALLATRVVLILISGPFPDSQIELYANLILAASLVFAAPAAWALRAPGATSHTWMFIGLGTWILGFSPLMVLSIITGAGHLLGCLFGSILGLILGPYLIYDATRKHRSLKERLAHPPPPDDLREVEELARRIAASNPKKDEDIIECQDYGDDGWWKVLLSDVLVFAAKRGKLILMASKEETCYALEPADGKRKRPWVAFFLKDHPENIRTVRLRRDALARLKAWKPPEEDAVLTWKWRVEPVVKLNSKEPAQSPA
jgi:hypothetical protein